MTGRRSRDLSPEERRLWEEVSRLIVPLAGRRVPPLPPPAPLPPPIKAKVVAPVPPAPRPRRARPASAPPATPASPILVPPVLVPPVLERRERLALRRGAAGIDAVLDLHGLRQAEAHAALTGFLVRAGREGHRVVLVVTGKGGGDAGETTAPWAERGVLRRSVPRWLALPDLRRLVVGVEEAGPRHGGGGALYVRLRRRSL